MSKLFLFALFACLFGAGGCVSVSLSPHEVKRASQLRISPPAQPFSSIDTKAGDAAWKSPSTGSIISYLSDCSEESDPTLANLRDDILRGLENVLIQTEEELTFQGRKALRTTVLGEVDGVTSAVDLLVLKKNSCSYVITFVSSPNGQQKDLAAFNSFLKGFEIP